MRQRETISETTLTASRLAALAVGLLCAAAAVILWRRLAGALVHPLEPGTLLATGVAATAVAAAARIGWVPQAAARSGGWPNGTVLGLTSLAAAGLVGGLWLPGTRLPPMLAVVAVLLVEEVGVCLWWSRRCALPPPGPSAEVAAPPRRFTTRHGPAPTEVVQQMTRLRRPDATEEVRGWLRVPLAAGQRTAAVHVAFCPPLGTTPDLLVEQIDGPEARLRTGQLLPYGARIDLKLATAADQPASVVLEFVARPPSP